MKSKHILTSDEKLKEWGYGEWVEEPDLIEFEHENFKCKIKRVYHFEMNKSLFGGHLCGYVCLSEGHPWLDEPIKNENHPDVHGGITYKEHEEDGFWIGFDCAHAGDLVPSMEAHKKRLYDTDHKFKKIKDEQMKFQSQFPFASVFKETYRNIEYVVKECKRLAEQAALAVKT